ncbi:MAG: hypothetical protein JWR21_3285 [Herminiimonas sp.]|nr:hypothetical protein [Herminiimonas sp.]
MKTCYVRHAFGEEMDRKLRGRRGWLIAGVASSISWPSLGVCVLYAGDEYILRGLERAGQPSPRASPLRAMTAVWTMRWQRSTVLRQS